DEAGTPALLFTENDTNTAQVFGYQDGAKYTKDAFHRYLVEGDRGAVNPDGRGTKAAAAYAVTVPPGETRTIRLRLNDLPPGPAMFNGEFEQTFADRIAEADEFYASVIPAGLSADQTLVARQAFAGLLWSKQYYHYIVKPWLDGDSAQPPPPHDRT